eukprot:gene8476-7753_t
MRGSIVCDGYMGTQHARGATGVGVGNRVTIGGLANAKELNGQTAVVELVQAAAGRVQVRLADGSPRSVKADNLTPAAGPPPPPEPGSVDELCARAVNSYPTELPVDPGAAAAAPNKRAREVLSGNYVPVFPTPLPEPYLVHHSAAM